MRARIVVVVVGGVGKDAIVPAAINPRHSRQRRHRRHRLNPTAAAIDNNRYCRHQRLPLPLPHSRQRQPPEASGHCLSSMAAMVVIVNGSSGRWRPRR